LRDLDTLAGDVERSGAGRTSRWRDLEDDVSVSRSVAAAGDGDPWDAGGRGPRALAGCLNLNRALTARPVHCFVSGRELELTRPTLLRDPQALVVHIQAGVARRGITVGGDGELDGRLTTAAGLLKSDPGGVSLR
jgi:hypothetical protein